MLNAWISSPGSCTSPAACLGGRLFGTPLARHLIQQELEGAFLFNLGEDLLKQQKSG
jgi:hypothetical protein